MIDDNKHLLKQITSYVRYPSRKPVSVYDSSKITTYTESSKNPNTSIIVGLNTYQRYTKRSSFGVINQHQSYPFEGAKYTYGLSNNEQEYKEKLNNARLSYSPVNASSEFYRGYFQNNIILEGVCELTNEKMPIERHEWISDAFDFQTYAKNHMDDEFFQRALSDDVETKRGAIYSMFELEKEDVEMKIYDKTETVSVLKRFRVVPETTPFLTNLQRKWIENLFPVKDVKSKGIERTTMKQYNAWLNQFYRGMTEKGQNAQWVGIPALIRVYPNLVAVHHITKTTYDEKGDTLSHEWEDTVVNISFLDGIKDKKSPNYQRFIVDRKVANEKAIGVTDMHRNACKICGKRDHNSKNCNIWDYGARAMKEAWDSSPKFAKAMPDIEFTVFVQPLELNRKSTRYGVQTLLKTSLYVGDSRKPIATLVLWGDVADDYLDWMNTKTLGEGWAKSKTKDEDIKNWRKENGGLDSLTHDRLILKAHDAWVKRPRYKNKEAWAIEVGINPNKGGYLEWTGEAYKFIPQDERTNVDDMYERVKISVPKRIIG